MRRPLLLPAVQPWRVRLATALFLAFAGQMQAAAPQAEAPAYLPRHLDADHRPIYSNELIDASSPYLREHAHDPVQWVPWGAKAFAAAKTQNHPVFLSVGFAGCEWCEIMHREAFEDLSIATFINANYVAVLVDREERPDIDSTYLPYLQALSGTTGWPMNLWLNDQAKAFYATSYLPIDDQSGGASLGFRSLLKELSELYHNAPDKIRRSIDRLATTDSQLIQSKRNADSLDTKQLVRLVDQVKRKTLAEFDGVYGGLRRDHKLLNDVPLRVLLQRAAQTGDKPLLRAALLTLSGLARGAIRDQIGGGFHRYAASRGWGDPHFEKLLIDNAVLVPAFLDAYQLTGREEFAEVVRTTLTFVDRDLKAPGGAFYAAVGADLPNLGATAKGLAYYGWTQSALQKILPPPAAAMTATYYHLASEQPTVPFWDDASAAAASKRTILGSDPSATLASARTALFNAREQRGRLPIDKKIITAWNGAIISALVQASFVLNSPSYLDTAKAAANGVEEMLTRNGKLFRQFAIGQADGEGFLEDYAYYVAALLDIFQATGENIWLERAERWQKRQDELFADANGGGYFQNTAAPVGPATVPRLKPVIDGEMPAANAVALANAVRFLTLTGSERYEKILRKGATAFAGVLQNSPALAPTLLISLLNWRQGPLTVVVIGGTDSQSLSKILDCLRRVYTPNKIQLLTSESELIAGKSSRLPLLVGKISNQGRSTVYLCRQSRCNLPTSDPEKLSEQLRTF